MQGKYKLVEVLDFLLNENDYEEHLDVIELSFRFIDSNIRSSPHQYNVSLEQLDDAIDELNSRFRMSGIGYQFVSGELVRVDSEFIH